MLFIKKLQVICLVIDQKIILIIFHSTQKSDIVLNFLNRKFLQMFLNNLNFISVSMHKAEVYKKFSFLDFTVESPKSKFHSSLLPSAGSRPISLFQGISQEPELSYHTDHHDQVERGRLDYQENFQDFYTNSPFLIPRFYV